MQYGVGSIAIAALFTTLGAEPEEIDPAVEILTTYPDPQDYYQIVTQARRALDALRNQNPITVLVSAGDLEIEAMTAVEVMTPCDICHEIIVFDSDHNSRLHFEHDAAQREESAVE